MNLVILVGNIGTVETKSTRSGDVVSVSLATSKHWRDDSGEKRERTEWHRVVLFKGLAGSVGKLLRKGQKLAVTGELRTTTYEKEGQKHYSTEVIANEVQLLSPKKDEG